jgi:hypothetical protein
MAELGPLAETLAGRESAEDHPTARFAQGKPLPVQPVLELGPAARVVEVVGEERPQGSDEPLIRPSGRLRSFPPVQIPRDRLAHDLTDARVVLGGTAFQGGEHDIRKFHAHIDHAAGLPHAWLKGG